MRNKLRYSLFGMNEAIVEYLALQGDYRASPLCTQSRSIATSIEENSRDC